MKINSVEGSLTDDQRLTLEIIYAPFRTTGDWPEYQYVDKALYRQRKLDAREFLPTFPLGLIYPDPAFGNVYLQAEQPIALTIAGIAACDNAEADLTLFLDAVKLFVRLEGQYDPPPTGGKPPTAGSDELQSELGFTLEQTARVYRLFQTELGLLGGGGGNPEKWSYELTPDIRRFADVESMDDYLALRIVPRPYTRVALPTVLEPADTQSAPYLGASGRIYRFIESLLAGGFGSVVRVQADDGVEFALKTLRIELTDPDALMREVANLRLVQHENVIRYIDYGTDPETFLVMELAHDGSLLARLEEARQQATHFPIQMVLSWTAQILEGLDAIHKVLIHRDLKPANVLFEGDTLKIGDFGIARVIDASTHLHTFKGWGTPPYLPPEGWAGVGGPSPQPTYDLYSLGVMLFELATLRLPFEGDRQTLSHAHLYEAPPPPRNVRPDLPPQFDALLLQLLHKDPARRGGSAAEILKVVHRIQANLNIADSEQQASQPAQRALERLRSGVSALVQQESEEESRRRIREEEQRKERDAFEAGLERLAALIDEAIAVAEANVAPLSLQVQREGSSKWALRLPPSPLELKIRMRQASPENFRGANNPGDVIGFGEVEVVVPPERTKSKLTIHDARAGANIVIYLTAEAPWVPHLQIIELENQPLLTSSMRQYEPFGLDVTEIPEHGPWLWGGAMHVFQASPKELSADVLVEWIGRLAG